MSSSTGLPETMRAQQWTSIQSTLSAAIRLNEAAPVPSAKSLKSDQVLVRVNYSSLNPADYKIPELPLVGRFFISKPASPCVDYAGTVVAAGSGRPDLSQGQRVFGMLDLPESGACSEYIVVKNSKESCVALPEDVKLEDAGGLGVASLTAYQCIVPNLPKDSSAKPSIFINGGSGGVGTFGIQIAKAKGCRVVTTCSARNVELCRSLGADEVIDYTKQDVVAALVESARTNGRFALAVDNVGTPAPIYYQAHLYLAPSAKFVAVGASISPAGILDTMKKMMWPAVLGGGKRPFVFLGAKPNAEQYRDVARMMAQGKVKTVIEEVYPLEDLRRAFERLYTGRVAGKLIIKVAE